MTIVLSPEGYGHDMVLERKGKEGKGRERKGKDFNSHGARGVEE